jgi:hypothetical protein
MSHQLVNDVIRDRCICDLSSTDVAILTVVASFANNEGVCWPSNNRIAARTRTHPVTVSKSLAKLRDYGYLRFSGRGITRMLTVLPSRPLARECPCLSAPFKVDEPDAKEDHSPG